jgi:hypothetical protein
MPVLITKCLRTNVLNKEEKRTTKTPKEKEDQKCRHLANNIVAKATNIPAIEYGDVIKRSPQKGLNTSIRDRRRHTTFQMKPATMSNIATAIMNNITNLNHKGLILFMASRNNRLEGLAGRILYTTIPLVWRLLVGSFS